MRRVAVLVVLALLVAACASPPPRAPARDEVRASVLAVESGLRVLDKACAELGTEEMVRDPAGAVRLLSGCTSAMRASQPARIAVFDALETWGESSASLVGCEMGSILRAYGELRLALSGRGVVREAGDDGEVRARWLGGMCRR